VITELRLRSDKINGLDSGAVPDASTIRRFIMGGMDNKTSIELSKKRKKSGIINAINSGKLHKEYLAHPTAQYQMTFSEFKKENRRKNKSLYVGAK